MSNNIFVAGATKPPKAISPALDATGNVAIYHPGYEPPRLLLLLVAFRSPSGSYGVPFSVVLDASRIVANNSNGSLRGLRGDVDLIPPNEHSLLSPGKYEYRVIGGEARYPVCTSFQAWQPPDRLPSHWDVGVMGANAYAPYSNASNYGIAVQVNDGRCILSGDLSRLKCLHLVPETEDDWWINSSMTTRTISIQGLKSGANCLAMRCDLSEQGMDHGHFVFAPYAGTAVCVCITETLVDFAAEYHLRAVQIPARVHPLNVYARFAWGLFRTMHEILCEFEVARGAVTVAEQSMISFASSTKRKRTEDTIGLDERESKPGRGAVAQEEALLSNDGDSLDDAALESSMHISMWTERDLQVAEEMDAGLNGRPLAQYEQAMGLYPGFSKVMRLQNEYRQEHPEVSAVRSARVADVWEDDDEQRL